MPTLPLPSISGTNAVPIDTGELPVRTVADVAAVWPAEDNAPVTAPVRDAIQGGQLAALLEYQRRRRYAAAQSDPLRATGAYADEIGGYERGVPRQVGELDVAYRTRYLTAPSVVDPLDIVAVANAVLAPFTSISCRFAEGSDGLFLSDGAPSLWSSHIFDGLIGSQHETPNYPDRLYPDATPAGLTPLPLRRPPGAMPADPGGRWFLLRVPDISAIDSIVAALFDTAPADGSGFFLTDGSGAFGAEFLFDITATSTAIYNALIGSVNAIIGQSIRWTLIVDTHLSA